MDLQLVGGERDFDLIFDPDADVLTGALKTSIMEEAQPRPIWHQPDGQDGNNLVDVSYDDGRMALKVMLQATNWPELLREVAALRRTVNQAHKHAQGVTGIDVVCIKGRPHDGCAWTYYDVKLVEDRSGGWLTGVQVPNVMVDELAFTATVTPAGYGTGITLANKIRNGHAIIQSATTGLAAGWTLVGAPNKTLDPDIWLNGGLSQQIFTDTSSTHGVYYQVTCSALDICAGYAWVLVDSGDPVTVSLYDGSGNYITGKPATEANASYTLVKDGYTWVRIDLLGVPQNANIRLAVERLSTDATQATTFHADNLYLETAIALTYGDNILTNPSLELGGTGGDFDSGSEIDDGTSDTFDDWTNGNVNDGWGNKVEATAMAAVGSVAAKITRTDLSPYITRTITQAVGASYRLTFQNSGDGSVAGRYYAYDITNSVILVPIASTGNTAVGYGSVTLYFTTRFDCSQFYIRFYSPVTAGTTYFDDIALQEMIYVLPAAWADRPQVYNRNDPSTTHPEYVNRLDTWGIPGDMPAWMQLSVDTPASPTGLTSIYMARQLRPELFVDTLSQHVLEIEDASSGGGAFQADSYCSGSGYWRFTGTGVALFFQSPLVFNGIFYVFARMRTSSFSNTVHLSHGINYPLQNVLTAVTNTTANRWQRVPLGMADLRASKKILGMAEAGAGGGGTALALQLNVTHVTGTLDVDYLIFLAAGDNKIMFIYPERTGTGNDTVYIQGDEQRVLGEIGAYKEDPIRHIGELFELEPGPLANRLIFVFTHAAANNGGGASDDCWVDWDSEIALTVIPRTRGWLP